MTDNQGFRTPFQRLSDLWGSLTMWNRFGLSFVVGVALVIIVTAVLDWLY